MPMSRTFVLSLIVLFVASTYVPHTSATRPPASLSVARSLFVASSSPGNAYAAGISVVVTAPVTGDLTATGGSIVVTAPVQGDELLGAGSISVRAPVGGDLRLVGGSVDVQTSVLGDLVAFGYSVRESGRAEGSVLIAGANVTLESGAGGPVTIYGNDVSLAGDFAGDVHIVSSGRIVVAAETIMKGSLTYEAPEPAFIAPSASIVGGVHYTNASYLPDVGTSRLLALVSIGFFLFVRILGALILAGLLAGLFPGLAETIVTQAYTKKVRSILLTMLLGFAILVATPVLLTLLLLTFVGIGLAFLLLVLYALLASLAFLYAGILLGSMVARRVKGRERVLWHDGVLGMLIFSAIALVPVVGMPLLALLTVYTAGALLQLFFDFAFPHR